MKKTDKIVQILSSNIVDKNILEVACGCAEFSLSASHYAHNVSCIDLDDCRLPDALPSNVRFEIMDASKMSYSNDSFDTIILYNAFYHIQSQWNRIEKECFRVLKPMGKIYIITTWKLDVSVMKEVFEDKAVWQNEFLIVELEK